MYGVNFIIYTLVPKINNCFKLGIKHWFYHLIW
jgi:hypothetical protein